MKKIQLFRPMNASDIIDRHCMTEGCDELGINSIRFSSSVHIVLCDGCLKKLSKKGKSTLKYLKRQGIQKNGGWADIKKEK